MMATLAKAFGELNDSIGLNKEKTPRRRKAAWTFLCLLRNLLYACFETCFMPASKPAHKKQPGISARTVFL